MRIIAGDWTQADGRFVTKDGRFFIVRTTNDKYVLVSKPVDDPAAFNVPAYLLADIDAAATDRLLAEIASD